jgi:Family of unknown function (DUF6186)
VTRIITILGYLLDGLAAVGLAIVAKLKPDKVDSFGELLDRVMASRAARVTIMLFWWWLGWHFLVVPPEDR